MAHEIQTTCTRGNRHSGISLLLCALIFVSPLVVPRMFYDFSVVTKEAVIQIGVMAIFALAVWNRRVHFPAVFPYVAAFLGYSWASLFWAVNPYEGFSTALHWSICALVILIPVNKDRLFTTIFASGVVVAVIGLAQYWFGFDFFQETASPGSTFANKNFAAHYSAVCAAAGFIFTGKRRVLLALGVPLILGYLWVCKTDAAFLAVLVMCFFICLKEIRFTICLIGLAIIWILVLQPSGLSTRIEFWKKTVSMVAYHPSGVGLGNFKVVYPLYDKSSTVSGALDHPHSEYVQVFADTGFAGIILMVLAFVGVARSINFDGNMCAVVGLVGICVVSMFSFPMRLPNMPLIGACYLGAVSK
jgi:hypothetical protein